MADFESIDDYVKYMQDSGYWGKDGRPLKCPKCDSSNIDEKITDTINYITCEKEAFCKDCGAVAGNWAYGNWQI